MILFTLAAAASYLALAIWTAVWGDAYTGREPGAFAWSGAAVWLFVFALPTVVTYVVADGMRLASPRWTLDHRAQRRVWAMASGVAAGALGAVGISVLLAATASVPGPVIFVACPAVATLCAVAPMRKLAAGRCVACGYDLRAATVKGGGRCPECGRVEG